MNWTSVGLGSAGIRGSRRAQCGYCHRLCPSSPGTRGAYPGCSRCGVFRRSVEPELPNPASRVEHHGSPYACFQHTCGSRRTPDARDRFVPSIEVRGSRFRHFGGALGPDRSGLPPHMDGTRVLGRSAPLSSTRRIRRDPVLDRSSLLRSQRNRSSCAGQPIGRGRRCGQRGTLYAAATRSGLGRSWLGHDSGRFAAGRPLVCGLAQLTRPQPKRDLAEPADTSRSSRGHFGSGACRNRAL